MMDLSKTEIAVILIAPAVLRFIVPDNFGYLFSCAIVGGILGVFRSMEDEE